MQTFVKTVAATVSATGTLSFFSRLSLMLEMAVVADKVALRCLSAAGDERVVEITDAETRDSPRAWDVCTFAELAGACESGPLAHWAPHDSGCIRRLVVSGGCEAEEIEDALVCAWSDAGEERQILLYRLSGSACFSKDEIARLRMIRPLLVSLVDSHLCQSSGGRLTRRLDSESLVQHLAEDMKTRLTNREASVIASIVCGLSTDAIARQLAVKATTVVTFRKRAYAKLGVNSRSELFVLCMKAMTVTPRKQPKPVSEFAAALVH